jgi:hypothetical protein
MLCYAAMMLSTYKAQSYIKKTQYVFTHYLLQWEEEKVEQLHASALLSPSKHPLSSTGHEARWALCFGSGCCPEQRPNKILHLVVIR